MCSSFKTIGNVALQVALLGEEPFACALVLYGNAREPYYMLPVEVPVVLVEHLSFLCRYQALFAH